MANSRVDVINVAAVDLSLDSWQIPKSIIELPISETSTVDARMTKRTRKATFNH